MAFLRLDGFSIPILGGSAKVSPLDIGSRERSFSGGLLTDRRARKRTWNVRTAPVTEQVAKAIEGAAVGLGDVWPFDYSDAPRLVRDFFTAKGSSPGATIGSIRFGIGKDGDPVVSTNGETESQYGTGSGTGEPAGTNILNADQRDVEGVVAGSFSAQVAGVLALETSKVLQGSQSLKITTTNAGDGAVTDAVAASSSTAYSGSVYLKWGTAGGGTRAARVILSDDSGGVFATAFPTLDADEWTRVTVTGTTDGAATTIQLIVEDNAAGGADFYADAWQIETGFRGTTWMDPSRAAVDLTYPASLVSEATDLTINAWVRGPAAAAGVTAMLSAGGPSDSIFLGRLNAATNVFDFTTEPGTDTISVSAVFPTSGWKMITAVLRRNPETGENIKTLYIDGVSSATSNPTPPDLSEFTRLDIGHDQAASPWGADQLYDDIQVLPFAATTAQILAWFNMGKAMPTSPRVYIDGDIMPDDALVTLAEGTVESNFLVATVASSGIRNNLRQLDLTLMEV